MRVNFFAFNQKYTIRKLFIIKHEKFQIIDDFFYVLKLTATKYLVIQGLLLDKANIEHQEVIEPPLPVKAAENEHLLQRHVGARGVPLPVRGDEIALLAVVVVNNGAVGSFADFEAKYIQIVGPRESVLNYKKRSNRIRRRCTNCFR
jgi:hypothetical protein